MRDSAFMGSGMTARVHVNGLKISGLPMDGFFYTDQNSGDVLIMVDAAFNFGDAKTTMKLEKGQTYYFLVGPNSSHITSGALWGALGGALGVLWLQLTEVMDHYHLHKSLRIWVLKNLKRNVLLGGGAIKSERYDLSY